MQKKNNSPEEDKKKTSPSSFGGSFADLAAAHAFKGMSEFIGVGNAIEKNEAFSPGIYKKQASFAEESKVRSTDADITGRGGYNAALNQAIASAGMKGILAKGATEADMMSFAKNSDLGKDLVSQLQSGIASGGNILKSMIEAGVMASADNFSRTQQRGKVGAGLKEIEAAHGEEGFVASSQMSGTRKGAASFATNVLGVTHD